MATIGGPELIKDGLVFGYDTNYGVANNTQSTRFYKGRPVTNLWDSIDNTQSLRPNRTEHFWDGKKWLVSGSYTDPGVPGPQDQYLGKVFKFTSGALSSSWSGNSYGYMLRDIVSTSGNYYTMSSWIYASSDCNVDSLPSVIEGEAGGESAVNSHAVSYNLGDKGTWQRIAKKAISDGNTRFICLYPRRNGVTDGSFTGFFMFAAPQVEEGTETSPYLETGTTRTSTQALLDVTKNTDIDMSNMSFDVIGQPEFDGTDDSISLPNPGTSNSQGFTIELVIKPNSYSNSPMIITPISHGIDHYVRINSSGKIGMTTILAADSSSRTHATTSTVTTGEYHHITFTYDSDTGGKVYYNNDLEYSVAPDWVAKDWEGTWIIGQRGNSTYFFNGSLPVLKVYNKVLGQAEITQNFNAYKNRFDI